MTPEPELDIPDYCGETPEAAMERKPNIVEMLDRAHGVEQTDSGHRFRFPGEDETLELVTHFALNERVCCPMAEFTLAFSGDEHPVELTVEGPDAMVGDMRETFEMSDRFDLET
jgi:hypothetical protein